MPRSQIIDVATQSLANPYGLSTLPPEIYETLWWYSGSQIGSTGTSYGSASNGMVAKGVTTSAGTGATGTKLFTLNSDTPASTKFAFEAACNANNNTMNAALWDFTSGSVVSGSQITATGTTMSVIRSGQFTLTPGHTYGVTFTTSNSSFNVYLTDASLIVFPNQQLLAQGSLSNITLGTVGQKLTEAQIPLWVYSSGVVGVGATSAGAHFAGKGSSSAQSSSSSSSKLHTLNSNWSPSQKFSFEASIYAGASTTAYFALWDFSLGTPAIVSASQISTTSTTATVIRSGSFTLTPGHIYGVTGWISGSNTCYLTKAHLVPLSS